MRLLSALVVACCAHAAIAQGPDSEAQRSWPSWRGPLCTGVAPYAKPPVEWGEGKNIRWKVEIPGSGSATPIVWGDRIYIQTAIDTGQGPDGAIEPVEPEQEVRGRRRGPPPAPKTIYRFVVMALDRADGSVVWQQTVAETVPHEPGHPDATQASCSPVTDGEHLYAWFGSRGLHCMDLEGNVKWSKDFGDLETRRGFGEGSSPAIHGNTIVVPWDHEGDSFVFAVDKRTGEEKWRAARDERTAWATPLIVEANGRAQVVTSATNYVRAYDLETGELIWQCSGMTTNTIPSPVANDELVIAVSGFRGNAVRAIRYADAKGDVSNGPALAWSFDEKGTPYVPSPLLYKGILYMLDNNRNILTTLDAKQGVRLYDMTRIEALDNIYASPVGANDHVYIVDRTGNAVVLAHGPEFRVVATNKLDDGFDASPVIVGDELLLRGNKHLYCIAE